MRGVGQDRRPKAKLNTNCHEDSENPSKCSISILDLLRDLPRPWHRLIQTTGRPFGGFAFGRRLGSGQFPIPLGLQIPQRLASGGHLPIALGIAQVHPAADIPSQVGASSLRVVFQPGVDKANVFGVAENLFDRSCYIHPIGLQETAKFVPYFFPGQAQA